MDSLLHFPADLSPAEILDDICCRFIINLPPSELRLPERICFQIEQAHWFYEDFLRDRRPSLPAYSLRAFAKLLFSHCKSLGHWEDHFDRAFATFIDYKVKVPVRGAILLSPQLDSVLLVKGWKSNSGWGFPKGKINQDEPDLDCAVRECLEETDFDISGLADPTQFVDRTIRGQDIRLYIIRNVPIDTKFSPRTRKEISKIAWHKVAELPTDTHDKTTVNGENATKYYMVAPFVNLLRSKIKKYKTELKKLQTTVVTTSPSSPVDSAQRLKTLVCGDSQLFSSALLLEKLRGPPMSTESCLETRASDSLLKLLQNGSLNTEKDSTSPVEVATRSVTTPDKKQPRYTILKRPAEKPTTASSNQSFLLQQILQKPPPTKATSSNAKPDVRKVQSNGDMKRFAVEKREPIDSLMAKLNTGDSSKALTDKPQVESLNCQGLRERDQILLNMLRQVVGK